jgi:hypothetical protein
MNSFKKINNNCFLCLEKGILIDLEQVLIILYEDFKKTIDN